MLISEVATQDGVENVKASNHGYYGKRPWWLGVRGARMGDNELQSIWWANLPSRLRLAKSRNWVLTREPRSVTDMRFDGWAFTKCRTEESVGDIKSKWQIYKRGWDKQGYTMAELNASILYLIVTSVTTIPLTFVAASNSRNIQMHTFILWVLLCETYY